VVLTPVALPELLHTELIDLAKWSDRRVDTQKQHPSNLPMYKNAIVYYISV
jgi:hypothetical protein